jgi:RNA polymerase sigma factor (sigma-70 family)
VSTVTRDLRAALSKVKAALMRRGRTVHDAEDLMQEAWVRLACYERNQQVEKPDAFLMRAALNLSIDTHRLRQSRGEEVMLEDVLLVDLAPGAEEVMLARERVARLSVCLSRLPDRTREILLANRIDDLSYAEIARQHQIGVSAVERHVAKALMLLTIWMEGW